MIHWDLIVHSGYDIINPANQAPPTDSADENDSIWILLALNESGDFNFQFDCPECGTKHIGNAKKPIIFFYLKLVSAIFYQFFIFTN